MSMSTYSLLFSVHRVSVTYSYDQRACVVEV